MSRRLRIAHVILHPVLVWDDGEELSPGPQTQPMQVPLAALAAAADKLREEVAQIDAASATEGP